MSIFNSKKLKELQSENEELKKSIDGLEEKESQLKRFDDLVKKARLEYSEIATKKDQTAQKLEVLERDKSKLIGELNKISLEIKQLREMKLAEHNQYISLTDAYKNPDQLLDDKNDRRFKSNLIISNEIEAAEKRKNDIALETFKLRKKFETINNKITDGKKVLDKLNADIEKKKEDIISLMTKQSSISKDQNKSFSLGISKQPAEEIQTRIVSLTNQERELTEKLTGYKKQLDDLTRQIEDKKIIVNSEAEFAKKGHLLELEIKIEAQETHLTALTEELKTKTELHNELNSENKIILEELKAGREELARLNESVEIETIRLTDLDYSLNILEDEFDKLGKDISDKISIKEAIDLQINEKTNQKIDLEDILKELKETTSIISQLKNDIEKGSGQSAKRFTGVLQYYSSMINDIYNKKTDVEKVLIQKEKELKDKQFLIAERQSVLQNMDNILFVRHRRTNIVKDLARAITEQRKMLETSGFSFDNVDQKGNAVVNSGISQKTLLEYENALKEILSHSDKYASDLITTRTSIEKEIAENKIRLNELNQNIRYSTSELSDLRNSISKIKVEHEEHRVSINKLASIKTKLEDQIDRHILVMDKYTTIKEKIKEEQELIKMKRELAASVKPSKKINEVEQTLEPHNPKWIKL